MDLSQLTPEEQRALSNLATDLPFFAKECLKIVDKQGKLLPFVLNQAQWYIHNRVEAQKRRTGKVRVVIIKGRQEGCLHPDTRVLMADLTWKAIKLIQPGEQLVACDEFGIEGGKQKAHRKMRTAIVEKKWNTRRKTYRITFDDGRTVICSDNHKWLSLKSSCVPRWRQVEGEHNNGCDGLKVGDKIRGITSPWGKATLDDAWFGGVIDGEGSFDHKTRTGADLAVSQLPGGVLDKMLGHCRERKYPFCVVGDSPSRKSKFGSKSVQAISISHMGELFRLFGLSRPVRFISRRWWEGKKLPQDGWRTITQIEWIGEHNLVDIQTSTRTFIAEGFVSHNCTTYLQARLFQKTLFIPNQSAYILAHQAESTLKIFSMASRFYANLPLPLQFAKNKDTEKSMSYEQGSSYTVGTAGSSEVGRGMTVQYFHGSEVAFYENTEELSTGLMQTVADMPGTEMFLESTANGPGNFFYNKVMQAMAQKGDFELIFIPWYWMDEYAVHFELTEADLTDKERELLETYSKDPVKPMTIENLAWRRKKIIEFEDKVWKFNQEYPCVEENEKVFTSRGLVALKDVQVGDSLAQGEVTEVLDKGPKDCVEVTTAAGYKIICTPDHRILTGVEGFVEAKDCAGKDIVLAKHIFGTTARVTFPMSKGFFVSSDITPDFARLMGYFMGDGSVLAGAFSFVCNERDIDEVEDIERLLRRWTDNPITRRKVGKKGIEIRLNDTRLAEIFDHLGLTELGAKKLRRRKVCVPEFIWRGSEEAAKEFLRGVIATDGFVYKNCQQIKVFAKEESFARDIQGLFTALGYKAYWRSIVKKAGNGVEYPGNEITLLCDYARKFRDEVGFLTQWQDDHAVERQNGYRHSFDRRGFVDKVINVLPVGPRRVFDLCVPRTDTFNAGGIVVHNCNVQEAFIHAEERFFDIAKLHAARKRKMQPDHDKPLIIGVDQGRTGDDTVIARRIGNVMLPFETIPSDDGDERDMRLAGRIASIIQREKPDKVFMDTTNEHGALDRLHELGFKKVVQGIHFGQHAADPKRHRNKRTEMHFSFRDWVNEPDACIPDDEMFMSECGAIPKEKETSNNLQFIVGKDIIKSNLGWSPNKVDAAILTFAYLVRKINMTTATIAQRSQSTIKKASLKPQLSTMKGVR